MEIGELMTALSMAAEILQRYSDEPIRGYFSLTNVEVDSPIYQIAFGGLEPEKVDEAKGLAEHYGNIMFQAPEMGSSRESHPDSPGAGVRGPDWIFAFGGIHCIKAEALMLMVAYKVSQLSKDQTIGLARRTENGLVLGMKW